MHIEGTRCGKGIQAGDADNGQSLSTDKYQEEIKLLQIEIERLRSKGTAANGSAPMGESIKEYTPDEEKVVEIDEHRNSQSQITDISSGVYADQLPSVLHETFSVNADKTMETPLDVITRSDETVSQNNGGTPPTISQYPPNPSLVAQDGEPATENTVSFMYLLLRIVASVILHMNQFAWLYCWLPLNNLG